ncbi:olfactory receptor 11L1-like [Rhinophrynus dorsalis]
MLEENLTIVNKVILLGFQNLHNFKIPFFALILLMYCLTICGNVLIIVLVSSSKNLQLPMYIFLRQLAVSDILLTTNISPNMLHIVLNEGTTISPSVCIFQYFMFIIVETSECYLLTVMSYDRYLAICNPLRYTSIMDHTFCMILIGLTWLLDICSAMILTVTIGTSQFCGQNVIDHFFCDHGPVLDLICAGKFLLKMETLILPFPIIILPFVFIVVSYVNIVLAVLKITSNTGRQKAFSTCSSHLAVVSLYYGILIGIYIVPNEGQSKTTSKVFSLFYTVVTPLINPIIYCLRNKDIKEALNKYFKKLNLNTY